MYLGDLCLRTRSAIRNERLDHMAVGQLLAISGRRPCSNDVVQEELSLAQQLCAATLILINTFAIGMIDAFRKTKYRLLPCR